MNFTPTIPFNRDNSYICKYIDSCVFLNHKKETNWLLETNGIVNDSNNNEKELNQLIEIILKNLNATGPNSTDFIDLTHESQTRFLNNFQESIQEYLKSKREKPKEKNFSIEFMEDLLPIALGKIFTPKTMINYIKLMSDKNQEIIPINFTIKNGSLVGVLIPVFTLNLTSDSLIKDVYEPIEKFITSEYPETKLIIPVLYTTKTMNQWNLLVIRKKKILDSKSGKSIYKFPYELFTTHESLLGRLKFHEKLHWHFKARLIPDIISSLSKNERNKLIDDFVENWEYSPISHNLKYQNLDSSIISNSDSSSVAAIQYIRHMTYNINMDFTGENIPYYRERIMRELFHDRIIEPPRDNLVRENKKRSLSPARELYDSTNLQNNQTRISKKASYFNINELLLPKDKDSDGQSNKKHQHSSRNTSLIRSKINNFNVTSTTSTTDLNKNESNTDNAKATNNSFKGKDNKVKYDPPTIDDLIKELISGNAKTLTSIPNKITSTVHDLQIESPKSSNKTQKTDHNNNQSQQQTSAITSTTHPDFNLQSMMNTKESSSKKQNSQKSEKGKDFSSKKANNDYFGEISDYSSQEFISGNAKTLTSIPNQTTIINKLHIDSNKKQKTDHNNNQSQQQTSAITSTTHPDSNLKSMMNTQESSIKKNITQKRRVKSMPKKVLSLNEVQPQVLSETELDKLLSKIDKEAKINPQTINNLSTSMKHTHLNEKGIDSSSKKANNDNFGEIFESSSQELISSKIKTATSALSKLLTPMVHNLHVESSKSTNEKQTIDINNNNSQLQSSIITTTSTTLPDSQSTQKSVNVPSVPLKKRPIKI